MDNLYFIIFFSTLAICFIFIAIIINVRSKKSKISREVEPDFIDEFAKNKSAKLKAQPNAMSFKMYATLAIALPIILATICWFAFKEPILVIIAVPVGAFIPECITRFTANNQKKNFDERYARALRQLASSLRAGLTIQQAVSDLVSSPFIHYDIKREFRIIDAEIKVGISIEDAFAHMAERVPTDDVKDTAAAIKMQAVVGGSEAETIGSISNNISSRIMNNKEIKTLFSGTKMTVYGMDILPFVLVVGLYFMSPDYFAPCLSTTTGMIAMGACMAVMIVGSFVIRWFMSKTKELQ